MAVSLLLEIHDARTDGSCSDSTFCTFVSSDLCIQFFAPVNAAQDLYCEVIPIRMTNTLTMEMRGKLQKLGFDSPGPVDNFRRRFEIAGDDDLLRPVQVAYRVLKDVFDLHDFNGLILEVHISDSLGASLRPH